MMRIIIILILLICQFIFGQSNNKLSINLDTVIDENSNDLTTKHSEYLYNKTTSLFSQEGFEINDTGFPTITPKLSKISNIESDDIYTKTMIVRLSLDIQVKSNSTTIASYNDELAGSGTTINEATLNAIDKLGGLGEKEKFKDFIGRLKKYIDPRIDKTKKLEEKRTKKVTIVPEKPRPNDQIPEKTFWEQFWEWINNFNNLLGVITALMIIFAALWSIRKKIKNKD